MFDVGYAVVAKIKRWITTSMASAIILTTSRCIAAMTLHPIMPDVRSLTGRTVRRRWNGRILTKSIAP
jgi:hypothetical protein